MPGFALRSAARVIPNCSAMPVAVSPGTTSYEAVVVTAVAALRPAGPSPASGTNSVSPTYSRLGSTCGFSRASSSCVTPARSASPLKVSPGATV